jgi:hypothetical protein
LSREMKPSPKEVMAGLITWGLAYWQLEDGGSQVLGDIATLILSLIPLGIAAIAIYVAVTKRNENNLFVAFFLIVGIVSFFYFLAVYFGLSKVGERSEVQRVIKHYRVLWQSPPTTVKLVIQLLVGAISTLACAGLLVFGGWELIQGSRVTGFFCGLIGVLLMFFSRHPERDWNYLWLWRSKLKSSEGNAASPAIRNLRGILTYAKRAVIKSRGR